MSAKLTAAAPPSTVALPKEVLRSVKPAETFPAYRNKWQSNEEVVSVLLSCDSHPEWFATAPKERPANGTVMVVNRKAVKYKKDGYCWKVRKDSKIIREDAMRLKVQSFEILKCIYAHSSLVPTFHRRSYWLFVNPDVVLVHYLNVINESPSLLLTHTTQLNSQNISSIGNHLATSPPLVTLPRYWPSIRKWNEEELTKELEPMFENCLEKEQQQPPSWLDDGGNNAIGNVSQLVKLIMEQHEDAQRCAVAAAAAISVDAANASNNNGNTPNAVSNAADMMCNKSASMEDVSSSVIDSSLSETTSTTEHAAQQEKKRISEKHVYEKFRPISIASTKPSNENNKFISLNQIRTNVPLVLNIQPFLALVQQQQQSTVVSPPTKSIPSEQRIKSSVATVVPTSRESEVIMTRNEISTQTNDDLLETQNTESSPLRDYRASNIANSAREAPISDCIGGFCNEQSNVPNDNTNSDMFNLNCPRTAGCTSTTPSSALEISPISSISNFDINIQRNISSTNAADESHRDQRSHSITSDLGFYDSNEFSPTAFSNVASVNTILYENVSLSPDLLSNPMHDDNYQVHSNAVDLANVNSSNSFTLYNYDLSSVHSDSFSSRGQVSSLGTVSSGSCASMSMMMESSTTNYVEISSTGIPFAHNTTSSSLQSSIPPLPVNNSSSSNQFINSSQCDSQTYSEFDCNNVYSNYVPNVNGSMHCNSNSSTTTASITDLHLAPQSKQQTNNNHQSPLHLHISEAATGESSLTGRNSCCSVPPVYTIADLPDLSTMDGFNEQMHNLDPPPSSHQQQHVPLLQINHQNSDGVVNNIDNSANIPPVLSSHPDAQRQQQQLLTYITEYSPSWCYENGGEKILIAGSWSQNNTNDFFQCQFGENNVPAALILPGVLRCLSPGATIPGIVPLSVIRNGQVLTHSVPFEYRPRQLPTLDSSWFDIGSNSDWLALNDRQFRYLLLSRLSQMQNHLCSFSQKSEENQCHLTESLVTPNLEEQDPSRFETTFEQRFVAVLQLIASLKKFNSNLAFTEMDSPVRGLTMLHLAAALGMPRLIDVMRSCSSQFGALNDLNPATLDNEHCSALTWACARGNLECALILHNWCHEMLNAANRSGFTPSMIARQRGHVLLVETLTDKTTLNDAVPPNNRNGKRHCSVNLTNACEQRPVNNGYSLETCWPSSSDERGTMSSCSEYDSEEDICSSGSVPPFGDDSFLEIDEQIRRSDVSMRHATAAAVDYEMMQSGFDCEEDDDNSPFVTNTLQDTSEPKVYNLAQQILRVIPERIKSADCEDSEEVRAAFHYGEDEVPVGVTCNSHETMDNNSAGDTVCGVAYNCSTTNFNSLDVLTVDDMEFNPSFLENEFDVGVDGRSSYLKDRDRTAKEFPHSSGGLLMSPKSCSHQHCNRSPSMVSPQSGNGTNHTNGMAANINGSHLNYFATPMEDLEEFIQGRGTVEAGLNYLTLSDSDQRTLYESAKIIQSAFRQYKQCRQKRQQEIEAAILIQSYFRKYKQYFSYKRMCRAARVIQKVFRRYKYSMRAAPSHQFIGGGGGAGPHRSSSMANCSSVDSNLVINNDDKSHNTSRRRSTVTAPSVVNSSSNCRNNNSNISSNVTSPPFVTYLSKHDIDQAVLLVQRNYRRKAKRKRENDAALKIQRFLRQCKNKIQTLRNNGTSPSVVMRYLVQ